MCFAAREPREFKQKICEQKPSVRCNPVFPQYDTVGARLESFKKWPMSAESLSKAVFFKSGTLCHYISRFVHVTTIRLKSQLTLFFLLQAPGITYPVSIVDLLFKTLRAANVYIQSISNIIQIVFTYSKAHQSL